MTGLAPTLVGEMPARLLAFVAAIAMVVGAVALRNRIDDDKVQRTTVLRLVCATELGPACEAMARDEAAGRVQVTIEEATVTAGRLTSSAEDDGDATLGFEGWLVTAPWPAMVAEARKRAGLDPLVAAGPVLARSPVVLAVWPERAAVLARHCGAPAVGWRCLGDNAGRSWADLGGPPTWGPLKPGHASTTTANGLSVVGAATTGYFERTDVSRADLDDDGYRDWLTRLERSIPSPSAAPLEDMLLAGPGAFDAVATLEADAGPLLARSARAEKPQLLYPAPVATADVVLGTVPGRRAAQLAGVVAGPAGKRALAGAGWRVDGQPPATGIARTPALPATSGLPAPGVLEALRQMVEEITR